MKFFPQSDITRVLSAVNMISLIKTETNSAPYRMAKDICFADVCPFCHNKHAMQLTTTEYKCFACGKGGNVIDFIMHLKNKTFVEAVLYLAYRHGIVVNPPPFTQQLPKEFDDTLYRINRTAAKFYFEQLRSRDGAIGMKYFEGREVSTLIRSKFGLGYAGGFGDTLYQHLKSKGFSIEAMLASGLISKSSKASATNPYYDRFWDRVMFPILDADSKVIGFGGRALKSDAQAKYLNSPETLIFEKGRNLYCYNVAKNSTRPYYICCEGYMDALSLHQFGFDCAVASLGTALTRDQIQLLSNKPEIILAYDSDAPGINAAIRAISLCREVGLKVKVLQISGAKDPDEFLKKFGASEFEKMISNAETDKHFLVRNSKTEDGKIDFSLAVSELMY